MAKTVKAIFSDAAYDEFVKGTVKSNNGLRFNDGRWYPDQPTYVVSDKVSTDHLAQLAISVISYVTFNIALPIAKEITDEKIKPMIIESIDKGIEKLRKKHEIAKDNNTNITDFAEYLKTSEEFIKSRQKAAE